MFVADSLRLCLRDEAFDSVISIAVVHHFSTPEQRLKAIRELARILRPGGTMLIYVWAFEQKRDFGAQDVYVPWHLNDRYSDKSAKLVLNEGEESKHIDMLEPTVQPETDGLIDTAIKDEAKQATVFHRYYHVFVEGELEELVLQVEGLSIQESFYDHENWCVIAKKD